ncbi:Phist protein [Plasmodium gonderi]|uniref:Phist protein n=1 Tax=Plasmodium gonderi TaxID=77519 RepID=A0A1Y1JGG1_PLAGO|nr:Phist protein [Plasmodium gonderi]GAW80425.1 Phist protein [Plasmodium gonderi]
MAVKMLREKKIFMSVREDRSTRTSEKKGKVFSTFLRYNVVFCVLVLSLFYSLIQNVQNCMRKSKTEWNIANFGNCTRSRKLSGPIPSHVRGFRRPTFTEDGEMVFQTQNNVKHFDMDPLMKKIYDETAKAFSPHSMNLLDEADKNRCVNNILLFIDKDNNSSEEMTDEELTEKIEKLKGPVDSSTILFIWSCVHEHERKKYIKMVHNMKTVCRKLASHYNVPWEYETYRFGYTMNKMLKMLMEKDEQDLKNIKQFATDDVICARWEFQRYLKLKRRSWNDFTTNMRRKWTYKLHNWFKDL